MTSRARRTFSAATIPSSQTGTPPGLGLIPSSGGKPVPGRPGEPPAEGALPPKPVGPPPAGELTMKVAELPLAAYLSVWAN